MQFQGLASELLGGTYQLPRPIMDSMLILQEIATLAEAKEVINGL